MDDCVGGTVALNTGNASLVRSNIIIGDIFVCCFFVIVMMDNSSLVDTMVPCWIISIASIENEGILFCFIVGLGISCRGLVVSINVSGCSGAEVTVVP